MTTREAVTSSEQRAALERACGDLPARRRERIVADLIAHLGEIPGEERDRVLSDPIAYVREMRDAWGLDIVERRPHRRQLIAILAAGVLVVAAGAGVGIWAAERPATAKDSVVMPILFGLTQDKATALLTSVGLNATITYKSYPEAFGTVLSQEPAEGVKIHRHARVVVDVAAPDGGPLLTSMPTKAVPVTQIAAFVVGKTVVLYYAAIAVGGPPVRPTNPMATVGGYAIPIPAVGYVGESGICKFVSVFTVGVGGPGSGACRDPRQLPLVSYSYVGGYLYGLTSLPASSLRFQFSGGSVPVPVTVATQPVGAFSGLRFFITKTQSSIASPHTTAKITAFDGNGKTLLSLTAPPS